MREPLVSVIIPSFNRALLLRDRSIPSVLRQTYRNWEIIVVGDGPPGSALRNVVEEFGDSRIRYTEIQRPDYGSMSGEEFWHSAGAAARNHGLSLARGEIIAPLDDDDEFTPGHLSECVAAIDGGRADLVYGKVIVRSFEMGRDQDDYFPWDSPGIPELFLRRNIMFHSSVCYSSRHAELRYPEDGLGPADYGLWLAIHAAGGRFTSLDTPQAIYYGDKATGVIRSSAPTLPPFEEVEIYLRRIYESRTLSNQGPLVQAFERKAGDYLGVPHVVSTPSGDIALILALNALHAAGDDGRREVLLPSYAHPSLINAVLWNGLDPVFCDVDARTLCVTPETVAPCLGPKTGIIAALHPHGFPADMPPLHALAQEHDVRLIADAAAALGATLHGRRVGGFGDMEAFSLSGTKILTAGEGGLVCCHDDRLADSVRRTARYGIGTDWQVEHPGINGKLAEIPCGLALAGLPYLEGWLKRRRLMEARYRELLRDHPGLRMVLPSHPSAVSSCKDMVLILPDPGAASALAEHLAGYRIVTRPYYRVLHRMPAYRRFVRGPLPATETLADCVVCVPLYSDIREEVVDFVAKAIWEVLP